jgi:type IV secretory pathway VirB3-like protein
MALTNQADGVALNDALNQPTSKFGIDFRLLLLIVGLSAAAFFALSNVLGLVLLLGLPAVARFFLRKDPQIFRLGALSLWQSAYYDPGKTKKRSN